MIVAGTAFVVLAFTSVGLCLRVHGFRSGHLRIGNKHRMIAFYMASITSRKENIMFEGLFQPMHLLVILGIALLVFGPRKLPELGKGLAMEFVDFGRP